MLTGTVVLSLQKLIYVHWDESDSSEWEERPIEKKRAQNRRTKKSKKSLLSKMMGKRSGGERQVSELLSISHSFFDVSKKLGTRLSSICSQGTPLQSTE